MIVNYGINGENRKKLTSTNVGELDNINTNITNRAIFDFVVHGNQAVISNSGLLTTREVGYVGIKRCCYV